MKPTVEYVSASIKMDIIEESEDNIFTLAAASIGSKCFNAKGKKMTFSEDALRNFSETWTGGIITLNHERVDDGVILASHYDEETGRAILKIQASNKETADRIRSGEPTGVSIEAMIKEADENNVIKAFAGTGVAIMFYPEKPACPLKDGCGILAKEVFYEKVAAADIPVEEIDKVVYDLSKTNNLGTNVKIGEVVVWNDGYEDADKQIVSYLSRYGMGTFHLTPESNAEVGDAIVGEGVTVTIDFSKTNGVVAMSKEEPITKEQFDAVVAKQVAAESELETLKNSTTEQIQAKDVEIAELKAEIERRDNEVAAGIVEEIKAFDPEFKPDDGMTLQNLQTIQASMKRASEKVAAKEVEAKDPETKVEAKDPEQKKLEESVSASNFKAPTGEKYTQNRDLTVGGLFNGQWRNRS